MEIKRGRYILRSDTACCWIDEEYIGKNGKKVVRNASGYYPTFRQLADWGLAPHSLRESEATSMKKLLEDMKKIEAKISKMTYKKVCELEAEERK
jgi:hypothetical protein